MNVKGWVQLCQRWHVGDFWQEAEIFGGFGNHPLIKGPELGVMQEPSLQLIEFGSAEAQLLASDQNG